MPIRNIVGIYTDNGYYTGGKIKNNLSMQKKMVSIV